MTGSSSPRYLLGLAVCVLLIFGAFWAYVLAMPEAFLESGYPIWEAKQSLISSCQLGQAMISGDSRAEAAIDPHKLDIPTSNISFGAETPVEGYFFTRRAMKCPTPPHEVLMTFAPPDFVGVSQFLWENGARFGYIHFDELSDIAATAHDLKDPSFEKVQSRLGFGGALRDLLFAVHFPPLYFNALLTGQIFRRQAANRLAYLNARQGLGHVPYRRQGEAPPLAGPAILAGDFQPAPVQTAYFERTLTLLAAHNVEAVYIPMPISEDVAGRGSLASRVEFESYLLGLARRHANFQVVMPLTVVWPNEAFVDGVHIEATYADRFTERFRACQNATDHKAGAVLTCDLSWHSVPANTRH